jgi:cytochrome oxidase Cu insertion factor (SCO1/SenC/PrrC family)
MKRRATCATLALAVLASAALGAEPDFGALDVHRYDPPKIAPAFRLPDLGGKTVGLEDVRGKVALLYFWATW